MKVRSLSWQLFIRVCPTILVTIGCIGYLAFTSATREINTVYDAQLISSANVLWTLMSDELREAEQDGPMKVNDLDLSVGNQLSFNSRADDYADARMFRVWKSGKLMLFSDTAVPDLVPRQAAGFSKVKYHDETWRIYALPLPKTDFSIEVGEKMALRRNLVWSMLFDLALPLLLLIPAVGGLMWIGIGSGLGTIRSMVRQIRRRSPDDLSPVDAAHMPSDLTPLCESINQLLAQLDYSFTSEKRFVDDAAHQLRTPLAAIKLQLQMLSQTEDETERSALTQELLRSSDRASKMIGQLLTSARLSHQPVELKPVSLFQVVSSVMAALGIIALQKRVEMSLDGAEDAVVMADDVLLRIMVENLVENAIKYSPEGGKVAVNVRTDGKTWRIVVSDTGPGIPAEQRELVFQRFYRPDKPVIAGSGLGLSIASEIARKFSGTISLGAAGGGSGLVVEAVFPVA